MPLQKDSFLTKNDIFIGPKYVNTHTQNSPEELEYFRLEREWLISKVNEEKIRLEKCVIEEHRVPYRIAKLYLCDNNGYSYEYKVSKAIFLLFYCLFLVFKMRIKNYFNPPQISWVVCEIKGKK